MLCTANPLSDACSGSAFDCSLHTDVKLSCHTTLPACARAGSVYLMEQKSGYDALMHDVCVGRGWCGGIVDGRPSHVDHFIPQSGPVTADQFVDWLFRADGMDPAANPQKWQKHKDALRAAFVRHMGSDVVDASRLKWDLD